MKMHPYTYSAPSYLRVMHQKKALLLRKDAKTLSLDTNGKIHGQ